MSPHSLPVENSAAVRAALLSYLLRKIGPLFEGSGLRGQLADFLAPLSTADIARALRLDAEETADRLADALLRDSAARDPDAAAFDVVACLFPHLPTVDRVRLAAFTGAVRELSIRGGGTITDRDFIGAGFGVSDAARLLPLAAQVQDQLDGRRPPEPVIEGDAVRRLIEAGTRAGLRFNPTALALRPAA